MEGKQEIPKLKMCHTLDGVSCPVEIDGASEYFVYFRLGKRSTLPPPELELSGVRSRLFVHGHTERHGIMIILCLCTCEEDRYTGWMTTTAPTVSSAV